MKLLVILIMLLSLSINVFASEVVIDIEAIIKIESKGRPKAVSPAGCVGLMQINPKGALVDYNRAHKLNLTASDLFDPKTNIEVGTWYINVKTPQYLKNYGIPDSVEHRLIAYNAGPGTLNKWYKGKIKLPEETKNYVKKYERITK